jgi:hypothetical protein
MRLSSEQIGSLAERVFNVLKQSGHMSLDTGVDPQIEDNTLNLIINVIEEDSRAEDRLSREAERLVQEQSRIAESSGKTFEQLVDEVKLRLAKSKKLILGDAPEKADNLGEKIFQALWKVDGIDFYSDDERVQNCIARAVFRFRTEDDRVLQALEKLTAKKTEAPAYSPEWCRTFDKYQKEIKARLTAQAQADVG